MWLLVTLIAHLFNAGAFVIDKHLLTRSIPNPVAYSFYIGLLGLGGFVLAPFGLVWYGGVQFSLALIAGATFVLALLFFFLALKVDDASRVVPFVGGVQPIFIFLLSFIFLAERLNLSQVFAFLLLVTGGIFISLEWQRQRIFFWRGVFYAVMAAAIFAISFVLTKYIYLNQNFISGFIWSRLGGGLTALLFLLWASNRRKIFNVKKTASQSTGPWFVAGQSLGALGFIFLNYAISLASVTLVNAMQGVQYAFLFLMIIFLSWKFPNVLREKFTRQIMWQKALAIMIIALGLVVLTF